ncbi:hypothetical protein V6N11_084187 [Hibiscus sabdariffa]|uniref:Uncharacterized protein n=1 Tax=Hibiscus sabdariffa TaxID=183260 RepID=A0ABR2QSM5_9ROSI
MNPMSGVLFGSGQSLVGKLYSAKRGDIHQTCSRFLRALSDEHDQFINSMTMTKRNKTLANICEPGTTWMMSAKGNRLVKQVALKSQAQGWNQFLKSSLMPTMRNNTVSNERMEQLHSIIMG